MIINYQKAYELLLEGEVVAIPTETVYGLAGRIDRQETIKSIFQLKERPLFDPLIVHLHHWELALDYVEEFPPLAQELAQAFWPGPLTMVLKKRSSISSLISAGLDSVAIRCPQHVLTLKLIRQLNIPLAAPSANMFGKTSPTMASHVEREFGQRIPVLDGGACHGGIESTVIKLNGQEHIEILRPGLISKDQIVEALKRNWPKVQVSESKHSPESPGTLAKHYQPLKPLVWVKNLSLSPDAIRAKIAEHLGPHITHPIPIELDSDPYVTARMLYQILRETATMTGDHLLLKFTFDSEVIWPAIEDRLRKASTLILD